MPLMAMTVSRASGEGMPRLEVSLAGLRATGKVGGLTQELGDLVSHIAWCWLLRCVS